MNYRIQGIGMTSRRTRQRMIDRMQQQGVSDQRVLDIMLDIPRHIFVDEALASRSYEDTALPIGHNQTISQPYIVGRMTELLVQKCKTGSVLEIGTGCGYQTAILAKLFGKVYSIERLAPLLKKARDHTWELKLKNISFQYSDGNLGWEEHAPYDAILVAAAPTEIPQTLLQQLAVGGVMIIPTGKGKHQQLHRITRTSSGFEDELFDNVVFVPFLSGKN